MASLKDTIKHGLIFYQSIFPTKGVILDHLFFTIGNGYEWKGGELVGIYEGATAETQLHNLKRYLDKKNKYYKKQHDARMKDFAVFNMKSFDYKPIIVPVDLEERMEDLSLPLGIYGEKRNIYPMSKEYSRIFTVPDDVKPDWLEGAFDAIKVAESIGARCGGWGDKKEVEEKETKKNMALLKKAKKLLTERFGNASTND